MFPLIATGWAVLILVIAFIAGMEQQSEVKHILIVWVIIGIFPPVFYKLMDM